MSAGSHAPRIDATCPLSPMQEGMLFDSLHSGVAGMNVSYATIDLAEEVDLDHLEQAWRLALEQYEALRTTFRWAGLEEPCQEIHAQVPFPARREDWSALAPAEQEARWRALIADERRRGFDMVTPPLMRLVTVRCAPRCFRLLWVIHHAIIDGLAMNVVFWQVFNAYDALRRGEAAQFQPLATQRDFVEYFGTRDIEASGPFWQRQLAGITEPTRFGIDRASYKGDPSAEAYPDQTLKLTEEQTAAITAWGRAHGVTPNTLILAAWTLMLARYSGERTVVFGVVKSGRRPSFPGAERQIGLLINTVPLVVEVPPEADVLAWLGDLRERWKALREHDLTPLTRIKEWSGIRGRQPLFESLVCFDHIDFDAALQLMGCDWSNRRAEMYAQANVPVNVNVYGGSRLVLRLVYDPLRVADESIARMLGHFEAALLALASSDGKRVAELSILRADEERALLSTCVGRTVARPADATVHGLVEAQVARTPQAVAVSFEGARLSYAGLDARAARLAERLRAHGVGPDTLVGLYLERGPELLVGLLGILKAGGAYVPLDPAFPAERLRSVLADTAASLLLTQRSLAGRWPAFTGTVLCVDEEPTAPAAGAAAAPGAAAARGASAARTPGRDSLAYVLHTSGSTGRPKGVEITHGAVVNFLLSMQREPGLAAGDVLLAVTTLSFDIAALELLLPLCVGARVEIASRAVAADGPRLAALLASSGATVLQATPATWQLLLHAEWPGDGRLKMLCGGEELPRPLAQELLLRGGELWNMYGPTETTIWSAVSRVLPLTGDAARHPELHPVELGAPIDNTRFCILDREGRLVPLGVAGELCIGGAGLARGYWRQPELTAERFVPSPWPELLPGRLYRTGDLVRMDGSGRLRFLGRTDHQVKLRGFRIELGEVEAALAQSPDVAEAVVLAREDVPGDKRLVAYVVPRHGGELQAEALRRRLRERLPDYMLPSSFVFLQRLPLSPNGKLNRRELPAPQVWQGLDTYTAPRNPTEAGVAEICADLLRLPRVGAHDDFFMLGGHSLLATRLVSRLQKQFQVELLIHQVFEQPTVAGLAEAIASERQAGRRSLPPLLAPARRAAAPPVSFAQGRLWFLDQLGAGAAYNMQLLLGFSGRLNLPALERSLAAIVARHETLRTRFAVVDGTPRQLVAAHVAVELPLLDRGDVAPDERAAVLQELATQASAQPFDLARGPLFRASLVRFAESEHALILTLHHVISDAWSLGVLRRELAAHYKAFTSGQEVDLPPLPVQYADFAVWQRDWLTPEVLESQLRYWREQLGESLPLLNLPTDRLRPAVQTFRGASCDLELRGPLLESLRALAREQGVTMAMLLLAAYQAVLARFTGQEDIVLGSPIANRRQPDLENLIGFFVNSLVLRSDLAGDPTFSELLARVRRMSLQAYDHQDLPFEQIVDALAPERDLARPPLFQATFAMQNVPGGSAELPDLELRVLHPAFTTTRFDLELYVLEAGDGFAGALYYNTDLFDAAFAEGIVEHLRLLLGAIVEAPHARLSELGGLVAGPTRALVAQWNATTTDYPRDAGVHELFAAQAARTPQAVAVQWGAASLTYAELNRRANRVAHVLRSRGAGPGVLVGLCMERGLPFIVGLLGVLKSGAAYVPLDADYPAQRLALMLADARPAVLLTLAGRRDALPAFDGGILCLDDDAPFAAASEADPPSRTGPDDLAYVIYTSGSTGRPKGVCVPHRAIVRLVRDTDYVRLAPDDVVAQASNAAFDAATFEIWGALLNGARLVGVPKEVLLSPPELAEQIRADGISVLFVTTALFNQLSLGAPGLFAPLRHLLFGGEAVDAARVRAVLHDGPPRRLLHVYGPTENTTFSTWHEVRDVPERARTVPIGRPLANTTCHVLDAAGNPVPVGAPGELHLGGDGVASGYLHDPELTARRFVPDPFREAPHARLYRTGDVVRFRGDGALEFVGRTDHQIKLRGFRIELGEIEAALARQERVRDAAVLCREDVPGDRRLVAYVVPDQRAGVSEEQDVVGQWGALYEDLYAKTDEREAVRADPSFNVIGWNSSHDGQPIPADEMREWVDETVGSILAARPRRVLELGFGTGLLLFRVAPHCEEYVGCDFSAVALAYVQQHLAPELRAKVTLHRRFADDVEGLPRGHFDVVVLNSIIQYFPSVEYLLRVIEGAVACLAPGGRVILGDVRNYRLLEAFQASVDGGRAAADLPAAELARLVKLHLPQEEELLVDPGFFLALPQHLPRVTHVEIEPKRGAARNELTQYRYQATLHADAAPPAAGDETTWLDWQEQALTEEALRERLAARPRARLGVRRIPNDRTLRDAELAAALAVAPAGQSVGELRAQLAAEARHRGVDPANLCRLAAGLGRRVLLSWASSSSAGEFDALFLAERAGPRGSEAEPGAVGADGAEAGALFPMPRVRPRPWDAYANRPVQAQMLRQLAPRLREALSETLPDHMLPAAFVMLESLPLNANGKVDRAALPRPESWADQRAGIYVPPRTPTERRIAEIWAELLGTDLVGVNDNFFALGGHSLMAMRVISRLQGDAGLMIPLQSLFDAPTVAGLAARVELLEWARAEGSGQQGAGLPAAGPLATGQAAAGPPAAGSAAAPGGEMLPDDREEIEF